MNYLNKNGDNVFADTEFDCNVGENSFFSLGEIAKILCGYKISYIGNNNGNSDLFYKISSKYITPSNKRAVVFCISGVKNYMKDYGQMVLITGSKSMKISKRIDYINGGYLYDDIEIREYNPNGKIMYIHTFHLCSREGNNLVYRCSSSRIKIKNMVSSCGDLPYKNLWLSFGIPNDDSRCVPSNCAGLDKIYEFDVCIDKRNFLKQFGYFMGDEQTNLYRFHAMAIKYDLDTILANDSFYSSKTLSYMKIKLREYQRLLAKKENDENLLNKISELEEAIKVRKYQN